MDNELKQDLTRRLSQCNRGGLILVMYDIYFAYSDDAKKDPRFYRDYRRYIFSNFFVAKSSI